MFFKQKTAYEMRISDWSSDVCSSDLIGRERKAKKVVLCARRLALNGRGRCDFGNRQETAMDAQRLAAVYLHIDTFMPQIELRPEHHAPLPYDIGRASCRERVCQLLLISVVVG